MDVDDDGDMLVVPVGDTPLVAVVGAGDVAVTGTLTPPPLPMPKLLLLLLLMLLLPLLWLPAIELLPTECAVMLLFARTLTPEMLPFDNCCSFH